MTPRGRPDRVGTGFTILWLTFWAAAILVAVWSFGAAALGGILLVVASGLAVVLYDDRRRRPAPAA